MPGAVLIEYPAHHLRVGVHVGRGDVAVGTEQVMNAGDKAASNAPDLGLAVILRVERDPALGAAERDVDQRCLPGHRLGQCANLIRVDRRVVAQSAFRGSTHTAVLDTVPDEDLQAPVVEADGNLDLDLAERRGEKQLHLLIQPEPLRRLEKIQVNEFSRIENYILFHRRPLPPSVP